MILFDFKTLNLGIVKEQNETLSNTHLKNTYRVFILRIRRIFRFSTRVEIGWSNKPSSFFFYNTFGYAFNLKRKVNEVVSVWRGGLNARKRGQGGC